MPKTCAPSERTIAISDLTPPAADNISAEEIGRFDALAAQWWNPEGPMRALHAMNGIRVNWIANRIAARFPGPVRLLDVGCGAGLAAEALAKEGHQVLGVDAASSVIGVAEAHAETAGLNLQYRVASVETLLAEGLRFPVVTSLEVIEHVPDPAAFVADLARLLEPGGLLYMSTINRTLSSAAFAKIGAEYIARILPPGTHQWRAFVTPAELEQYARQAGLCMTDIAGMRYTPGRNRWVIDRDVSINYIAELRI